MKRGRAAKQLHNISKEDLWAGVWLLAGPPATNPIVGNVWCYESIVILQLLIAGFSPHNSTVEKRDIY